MTGRWAAVAALAALLTASCGGGDDGAQRDDTTTSTVSRLRSTTTSKAAARTITGDDVTVTVEDATAVVTSRDAATFGTLVAVDGDDVVFRSGTNTAGRGIARVNTATAAYAVTDARMTGQTAGADEAPVALTSKHVWGRTPGGTQIGDRTSKGFTVLDRSTLAVVGQYPLPAGELALGIISIGERVFALSRLDNPPLGKAPDDLLRTLSPEGTFGEAHRVAPVGWMVATTNAIVLTSPVPTFGARHDEFRVLDPSTLREVGRTDTVAYGSEITGGGTLVRYGATVYDVADPTKIATVKVPPVFGNSLRVGGSRLFSVKITPTTKGSNFDVAAYDATSFAKTASVSGRAPYDIGTIAHDNDRVCMAGGGGITCVTLNKG